MNKIFKVLITCCLILQTNITYADISKTIVFDNQHEEAFDLENFLKQIKMVDQEVVDTCTRKVPYEENVCRDVTKYKKECATIPAHEECRNVNDPICHTETSMEEQCYPGPSRQQCRTIQVPVCNTETRYENECHTTPSRQECRTVNEPQCRVETRYDNECRTVPGENQCRVVVRYRQECSQTGGGQQCRTIPGEVRCERQPNGENRCTKIPPREECSGTPSRQECRQVPYEERECTTGPSRQECRQVPREERICENRSRQECTTVPGQYECRQVPKYEQVCHNESRQDCTTVPGDPICRDVPRDREVCRDNYRKVCENVPAREACKDIPYVEQVCKMETKYKDEQYQCKKVIKVPKEVIVKTHKAKVEVEFNVLSEILGPEFTFDLDTKGDITIKAKANKKQEEADGKIIAAFVKKNVKAQDIGEVNEIAANYKILLLNKKDHFSYLDTKDLIGELSKYSFTFSLKGKINTEKSGLALKIVKKGKTLLDKKIY